MIVKKISNKKDCVGSQKRLGSQPTLLLLHQLLGKQSRTMASTNKNNGLRHYPEIQPCCCMSGTKSSAKFNKYARAMVMHNNYDDE